MIFWSLAQDERNSMIVGGVGAVKSVKLRPLAVINELYQLSFTKDSGELVKIVLDAC